MYTEIIIITAIIIANLCTAFEDSETFGIRKRDTKDDHLKNANDLRSLTVKEIEKLKTDGKTALAAGLERDDEVILDIENQLKALKPTTEIGKALFSTLERGLESAKTKLRAEINKVSESYYEIKDELVKKADEVTDLAKKEIQKLKAEGRSALINFFLENLKNHLKDLDSNTVMGSALSAKHEIILENDMIELRDEIKLLSDKDLDLHEDPAYFMSITQTDQSNEEYFVYYINTYYFSTNTIARSEDSFYKLIDYDSNSQLYYLVKNDSNQIEIHKHLTELNVEEYSANISYIKNVGQPNSLAVDWIHDLIYWIDSENNQIKVVNHFSPNEIYAVVKLNNNKSRNLIINVEKSLLLWISVEYSHYIMESTQDGKTKQKIIYRNESPINHLTIDYQTKSYFFTLDNTLVSMDYNSHNQKEILKTGIDFSAVINMFIINKEIYFTTNKHLVKLSNDNVVSYEASDNNMNQYNYVIGFNNESQPELSNKCSDAICSHMCVPTHISNYSRCLCPTNMIMINETCQNITTTIYNVNAKEDISDQGDFDDTQQSSYFNIISYLVITLIIALIIIILGIIFRNKMKNYFYSKLNRNSDNSHELHENL